MTDKILVRLKVAASLDARTALPGGESKWITSEAARADGHAWRARADAILTGVGTVLADDPGLDVRLATSARQPDVVVVDSHLRTPPDTRLFLADRRCYFYAVAEAPPARRRALEDRGAVVVAMPDGMGRVHLPAMLQDLHKRGLRSVHVEAGATLNGALLRQHLVDELLMYLAPRLLGKGLPLAELGTLAALSDAIALEFQSIDRIGPDLRVLAKVLRRTS